MGHTINTEGFEVLRAFESNSRVGRAMPKLVNGCALGVATMRTSRVGKGIEEGKFFFGEAAKGMNEKKPRMKFRGHGLGDSAHDPWVKPADVGHICACTGTVLRSHTGACKVHQWLQHPSWASAEVQLELVSIESGPLSVHAHAVIMKLQK